MRLAVAGLGTVGSWLLDAVDRGEAGEVDVVLTTSGRDGREGELNEVAFDVLADCVNSPAGGEPGASFIRDALARGRHVITSDKWPVALHGVEFAEAAGERGVEFRAESTVMSGTPLLARLREATEAGNEPVALRGILNATVNSILTRMSAGAFYADALAKAQEDGLAEPDPSADVDGRDECAKAMVLAALVFGEQLSPADVSVRGISSLSPQEVAALQRGEAVRSVTTIARGSGGPLTAKVEPQVLAPGDHFETVDGVVNAVVLEANPRGTVVAGPGAGPEIAGKGVLDDLRSVAGPRG